MMIKSPPTDRNGQPRGEHNKMIKLNANWMKTRTPKTAIRNRKMTIKYTYNICH